MKGSAGKSPTTQWYHKDWLSDQQLQRSRASTRGIWMNLLMYMKDCPNNLDNCTEGTLEYMDIEDLCKLGHCTVDEAWLFIQDAVELEFCNVSLQRGPTFHIMSRRLSAEAEQRRKWRKQKSNQRKAPQEKDGVHPNVRDESNQSPSVSPIPSPIPSYSVREKKTAPFGAGHFSTYVGKWFSEIKTHCEKLKLLSAETSKDFNPFMWVQKAVNHKRHPGAINDALVGLIKLWDSIESPWAYAGSILKTKNGNWNERDAIAIHKELKAMTSPQLNDITSGLLKSID